MHGLEHDEGQQMSLEEEEQFCTVCNGKGKILNGTPGFDLCDACYGTGLINGQYKEPPKLTDPDWREKHQKQQDELYRMVKEIYELFDHEFFNKLLKELGKCK